MPLCIMATNDKQKKEMINDYNPNSDLVIRYVLNI